MLFYKDNLGDKLIGMEQICKRIPGLNWHIDQKTVIRPTLGRFESSDYYVPSAEDRSEDKLKFYVNHKYLA